MDFRPVDPPLYGVQHDVVRYQNMERLQELDHRILSRFVPEGGPLPPNFGPRPAMTKYAPVSHVGQSHADDHSNSTELCARKHQLFAQ